MKHLFVSLCCISSLSGCVLGIFGNNDTTADVMLYWSAPQERANGDPMPHSDIGGYEIRYQLPLDDTYEVILVSDPNQEQLLLPNIKKPQNYIFEVAVFDIEGTYSDFVTAVD